MAEWTSRIFSACHDWSQGCQMVCCQTQNPNLGKFWRVLQWKMLVYFMDTWSIWWSFVIFYGHLVQFVVIWYIFPRFGILYQEKSGDPDWSLWIGISNSTELYIMLYIVFNFKILKFKNKDDKKVTMTWTTISWPIFSKHCPSFILSWEWS
jgi:hypothetical protein